MKGMILAAGLGTRLKPLTDTVPKPAVPLLGVPLGYWPLFHLINGGVTDLVVNTHYLPEKVVTLYEAIRPLVQSLKFSSEKEKILGSGGGVGHARALLEQTSSGGVLTRMLKAFASQSANSFWLANGDEVFIPDDAEIFQKALARHKESAPLATLLVMNFAGVGTKFGGVWCDDKMRVRGFGKASPAAGLRGYHFIGFQILSREIFKFIPDGETNIFYDIMIKAIEAGQRIEAFEVHGKWFETGNVEDLKLATSQLSSLRGSNQVLDLLLNKFKLYNV